MNKSKSFRRFPGMMLTVSATGMTVAASAAQNVQLTAPTFEDRRVLRRRMRQWAVIGLILLLAVPVAAQMVDLRKKVAQPSGEGVQVTQQLTIAVCGETCNCGSSGQMSKAFGPCTVNSTTGSCTTGSGECCVCAVPDSMAVCGEETCDCGNTVLITQVTAPCSVTSSTGQCHVGTGACCICAAN